MIAKVRSSRNVMRTTACLGSHISRGDEAGLLLFLVSADLLACLSGSPELQGAQLNPTATSNVQSFSPRKEATLEQVSSHMELDSIRLTTKDVKQ